MKVLVTDAYSTSNIGDAELVRLTTRVVSQRYGVAPVVFATDPQSFVELGEDIKYLFKPLSRLQWRSKQGLRKYGWLVGQVVGLFALVLSARLPRGVRSRVLSGVGRATDNEWLREWDEATHIVGVGGGYLGDRYRRESFITLLLFWVGVSSGKQVETMPVSVTSINDKLLKSMFRRARKVRWRVREETSHELLANLGVQSRLIPDLAWLDVASAVSAPRTIDLLVAPVGASFYTAPGAKPKVWDVIEDTVHGLPRNGQVSLVPMHIFSAALGDGGDDNACIEIESLIISERPDLVVTMIVPRDYQEVRNAMASAKLAVCERLHAALAGLTTDTRTRVVGYEPKHVGVLKLAGLEMLAGDTSDALNLENDVLAKAASDQCAKVKDEFF